MHKKEKQTIWPVLASPTFSPYNENNNKVYQWLWIIFALKNLSVVEHLL